MKVVSIVLTSLTGYAHAGRKQIVAALQQAQNAHSQRGMLRSDIVASMQAFQAGDLVGYGCNCMFDDDAPEAGGPAQDHFDQNCADLSQGYRCIIMENSECGADPWNTDFVIPPGSFNMDMNDPTVSRNACEGSNAGDECKILACQVEMAFIDYVIQAQFIHVQAGTLSDINDAFKHPAFDVAANCPKGDAVGHPWADQIGSPSTHLCCGLHPSRVAYNTAFKQCSADGTTLTEIGT